MSMKFQMTRIFCFALTITAMIASIAPLHAQEKAATPLVPVKMTVTVNVADDKRMPEVTPQDVFVKKGKERLKVTEWVPARGERAGLDLFFLIDDASDTSLGSQLAALGAFI